MKGESAVKKRMVCIAVAWLMAVLAVLPALAAETAPLSLRTYEQAQSTARREDAGQIDPFGSVRAYMGVSASDQWLKQARIGGLLLNLRLFTPEGEGILFQEKLGEASTGGKDICLYIRQNNAYGGMMLQFDQNAVDVLKRVNITEIVVMDYGYYIQNTYRVEDFAALRDALSLSAQEQLCVSGAEDPVSVVSADGVRRIIQW